MAEYIEREALAMQMMHNFHNEIPDGCNNPAYGVAIGTVEEAPAADVAPVVHGRWRPYPDCGVTRCSVCDWSIEECIDYKYCPNCGARMDKEDT